ncbi:MAG: hypothetical protein M0Z55_08530 [Peptococcaceae bacterium]|nr:hypothetical protein [Peptococcaceae bacterium]
MNELAKLMHKGRKVNGILLGLTGVVAVMFANSLFWPGALVGLLVGAINLEILFSRMRKSENNPQMLQRTGLTQRFGMATLGILVVIKFKLGLAGFFLGLMLPHIIVSLLYVLPNPKKERGE